MPTKFPRFRCSVCSVKKVPYRLIILPHSGTGCRVLLCFACAKAAMIKLSALNLEREPTLKEHMSARSLIKKTIVVPVKDPYHKS